MGATASVFQEQATVIPEEIRILLDVCERQKAKIAEAEADLVEREVAKMFKGHAAIIDRLTGHSKSQLQRLFTNHASTVRHLDALVEAGNHYAKFIKQLVKSKDDLEWEAISTSSKPDYDEELLTELIGCSTTEEIQKLDKIFLREKTFCLADLFAAQTKPDSQLRHFMERILRFDRDESKTVDKNMAVKQAAIIHKAGAARLIGVDEEPILDILSTASRAQCAAINEAYIDLYKMKLERAINMKFKGNAGKLIVLWTQPLPSAIVTSVMYLCQKMLVDKNALMNFLAKYEKDTLASADEAAKAQHKKSLAELVGQGVSGTLHRALKGWIELPSPDKGFERILDVYMKTRLEKGMTLEEVVQDPDLRAKIHFLIEKQAQEMKLYMIDRKIKLDSGDQAILARSFTSNVKKPSIGANESSGSLHDRGLEGKASAASMTGGSPTSNASSSNLNRLGVLRVSIDENDEDHVSPLSPGLRAIPEFQELENRRATITDTNSKEYEAKSKKVYEYLVEVFERADKQSEGSLSTSDFWRVLYDLPLRELGFTQGELDIIRSYSQWDCDGRIFYYEILFEFGDSVIASIENKKSGDTNVLTVIEQVASEGESHYVSTPATLTSAQYLSSSTKSPKGRVDLAEASLRKGSVYQYPNIPIDFRQFLINTLTAFDLDCNGFLTDKELQALVEVINIPDLTVASFLGKGLDYISPKEASDVVLGLVNPLFTSGATQYICLVDRDSGAYFWYNTSDGSTQWADAEYAAEQPAPVVNARIDEADREEEEDFGPTEAYRDGEETKDQTSAESKEGDSDLMAAAMQGSNEEMEAEQPVTAVEQPAPTAPTESMDGEANGSSSPRPEPLTASSRQRSASGIPTTEEVDKAGSSRSLKMSMSTPAVLSNAEPVETAEEQ